MQNKRRKNKGQTAIEFAAFLTAFLFAILIFQKYIVRAISGQWKSVGDSIGQERIYDPNKTVECRYFTFFEGETGMWFDQKCFVKNNCAKDCLLTGKTAGACNTCLAGCADAKCQD